MLRLDAPRHALKAAVAVFAMLLATISHAQADSGQGSTEAPSLASQVEVRLLPILRDLQDRLLRDRLDLEMDGVQVFGTEDKFLPGKIAIGASHLVMHARDDAELASALEEFRETASLTLGMRNESWGIYYYLSALHQLDRAGLLEDALDTRTLTQLRESLDWRTFIDPVDYSTTLPTNYYGVAFSIARLRHLLGWEKEEASEILLARTLDHYRRYSGEHGFSDETEGEGRFDRYSVLLIAELAHRFRATELDLTPEMEGWLRNSAEFVLMNLNEQGTGFQFGRSIGPYGDTAFLEVLSAAAWAGVLSKQEKDLAYAFSQRAFTRYLEFWYDPEMGSVNLWEKGRRTDGYRGKHRILGENLSLMHQLLETNAVWRELGYAKSMISDEHLHELLQSLPTIKLTRFSTGEPFRGALTYRDKGRVFSLWLVNGARNLYDRVPYYPVPFSSGVIEPAPNAYWPQLVPRIRFTDGTAAMPLVYFHDLELRETSEGHALSFTNHYLARTGSRKPVRDERASATTEMTFKPGSIQRRDTIRFFAEANTDAVEFEFAFSTAAHAESGGVFRIASAPEIQFSTEGLDECSLRDVSQNEAYRSAERQLITSITCHKKADAGHVLEILWTLNYGPVMTQ